MAGFDELALQYVVLDDESVMRDMAQKAAKGLSSAFDLMFVFLCVFLCLSLHCPERHHQHRPDAILSQWLRSEEPTLLCATISLPTPLCLEGS